MRPILTGVSVLALTIIILVPAQAAGTQCGIASWYGLGFHGRATASGERFDQYAMTAAHPSLPFGTLVRVTRADGQATVQVRINDRGPYAHGRIIDLSRAAAEALGMIGPGVLPVQLVVVEGNADLGGGCR